jgi:hypothetical protein
MKKSLLLVALLTGGLTLLSGCGGSNGESDSPIVGQWKGNSVDATITLNSEGEYLYETSSGHQIISKGSWSTSGDTLTLVANTGETSSMQYSVSGDTLTLTNSSGPQTFTRTDWHST